MFTRSPRPVGATRIHTAVAHLNRRGGRAAVVDWLRAHPASPTGVRPGLAYGWAAFRYGADDLLEPWLIRLADRFPDSVEQHLLHAAYRDHRGDHESARRHARAARLLDPTHPGAAALTIRTGYRVDPRETADLEAVDTVRRLPCSVGVLRAASDHCGSNWQFRRLKAALDGHTTKPHDPAMIDALAAAALRAGDPEAAAGVYRQALSTHSRPTPDGRPAGIDGSPHHNGAAIADVNAAFASAGLTHFATRHTLYGLVAHGDPVAVSDRIRIGTVDASAADLGALFDRDPAFVVTARRSRDVIDLTHRIGTRVRLLAHHRSGDTLVHEVPGARWRHTQVDVAPPDRSAPELPVPRDAGTHLAETYGTGRPHDHDFLDGGTGGHLTDPAYLRAHHFATAWHDLCHQDAVSAAATLSHLGEAALAATLTGRKRRTGR